ncbi:MAG: chorismate--pyruvate lyase [Lachnospiraceae bacterium]|nr:chorismate--pyruvate lyase [Lachnospiraceae bacterium]
MNFGPIEYVVARIDGDYAYLQQIEQPEEELKCVARALLPPEIAEGTMLHYEMMEYSLKGL